MDRTAPADPTPSAMESVMVDVAGLSLADLAGPGDSALDQCLRRLLADLDTPGEPIAGFNSAL